MAALGENYQQPAKATRTIAQSRRILKWLVATGLAIGKQSTSASAAQTPRRYLTSRARKGHKRPIQNAQLEQIPSQYILIDRHINSSVQVKLVVHS